MKLLTVTLFLLMCSCEEHEWKYSVETPQKTWPVVSNMRFHTGGGVSFDDENGDNVTVTGTAIVRRVK